ncbi:MAG: hypothetical protein J0L99_17375 [Chitinophagales bacterium]|nr:hypothetical protein [Chitinophagales bacterium]
MNRLILTCLSFCLCFLAPILGQAQGNGITFYKSYGRDLFDQARTLCVLPDGYLLAGSTEVTQINADACVLRLDEEGKLLWQRNFGANYDDYFHDAIQLEDGGFLLYGKVSNVINATEELCLIRLDAGGNTLWQKQYGQSQRSCLPTGPLVQIPDGYILCATQIQSSIAQYYALFIRVNLQGELVWQTAYAPAAGDFSTRFSVYGVSDSLLIAGGNSGDGGRLLYISKNSGWINRHYKWAPTSGEVYLSDMGLTTDGNFVYAGHRYITENGSTTGSAIIHKVNRSAEVLWTKLVQVPNWLGHSASISLKPDDGFFLKLSDGFGHTVLCNFDKDGKLIWSRSYEMQFHEFADPSPTPDGGFAICGTRNANSNTPSDMVLLKLDAAGNFGECAGEDQPVFISNYTYPLETKATLSFSFSNLVAQANAPSQTPALFNTTTICGLSTGTSEVASAVGLRLFPNPAREIVYLEVPKAGLSAYSIFDARGGLLYHATTEGVAGQMLSIPLDGIAPGAYLLGLQLADGSRRSTLFVRM